MALGITEILNQWASYGVFSYLFPFLIIFAIIFAILQKTKLLGDPAQPGSKNVAGINALIAIAIGFLALLNDYVPTFFATIFPRFGIAIAIFLIVLILVGFFVKEDKLGDMKWVGWVLAVGVVVWAWSEWDTFFINGWDLRYFIQEYFWGLVLAVGLAIMIYWIVKGDKPVATPARSV